MSTRAIPRISFLLLICTFFSVVLPASATVLALIGPPAGPTGMQCASGGPTFDLETTAGYIYTPDGNRILMWGYTLVGNPFQMPGPVLCVTDGNTVTINLTNNLDEPVSIVFPGQSGVSASLVSGTSTAGVFTLEANPGATVSYAFTASEPGTYLYESGTEPQKQIHMGLYGALVVYPTTGGQAYDDAGSAYDAAREYLILIHEIDPDLHLAVEEGLPYDITQFHPEYWTINGRAFPDTLAENNAPWLPNQPYSALVQVEASASQEILIRYANVGMDNHPFHPHGNHLRVIARDGRRLVDEFEDFTRTIGSGQTYDLLFRWDDVDPWVTGPDPVPVTIPGLQNLVFKDGAVFYSGDPKLGNTGEFPVGVTSFNECGEFYFPWHSHALFEFTNFNEGFGGLATALRVDPPGGC